MSRKENFLLGSSGREFGIGIESMKNNQCKGGNRMVKLERWMIVVAAAGLLGFTMGNAGAEGQNPFEKAMEERFTAMDANKDGKIDYDEYSAGYQKSIKSSFERRDQNGDGALSKDEFMPKMGKPGAKGASNPFQQMIEKKKAAAPQEEKAAGEKKGAEEAK
jgi:Ca2+-binding EF-hand superfamily protein